MYTNYQDYLITFMVAIFATFIYDRFYTFFHRGEERYKIENDCPRILYAKKEEIRSDSNDIIVQASIRCMCVCSEPVNDRLQAEEKEISQLTFVKCEEMKLADDKTDYAFKLSNHTEDGISFDTYTTKGNENLSFASCNCRHLDAKRTIIVLFSLRDRPSKILVKHRDYMLEYFFDGKTGYITPEVKKKQYKRRWFQ